MTAILRIDSVSRRFGGYLALSNVSCEIAEGHIHGLIGPNGAGKTTLFNIIGGNLRPSGGRLVFRTTEYTGWRPDRVSRIGVSRSFQHVRLVPGLTVVENVMLGCHAHLNQGPARNFLQFLGVGDTEAAARKISREMLNFVGFDSGINARPDQLTLAAQRRIEIARALASRPQILLLDEPAAGMNPTEIGALNALIRKIRERGITTLLVEHNMRLIMGVADTITVLRAGQVIANGPPAAIQQNADVIAAYLGPNDGAAFSQ